MYVYYGISQYNNSIEVEGRIPLYATRGLTAILKDLFTQQTCNKSHTDFFFESTKSLSVITPPVPIYLLALFKRFRFVRDYRPRCVCTRSTFRHKTEYQMWVGDSSITVKLN